MTTKELDIIRSIITYYREAEDAYRNWGKDEEGEGIYALHGGLHYRKELLRTSMRKNEKSIGQNRRKLVGRLPN